MNKTLILRIVFIAMVVFSITVMHYQLVVQRDFEILTSGEGPDTSDYFLTE